MTTLTHDSATGPQTSRVAGLGFAIGSAAAFGLAGALAAGLMDAGWNAAGAVTARVCLAAVLLLVPALLALGGRWALLRSNLRTILVYGVVAVAGCQLAYFNAVRHMDVGVALLIEYTAPVAVIGWLWLRHGQRPGRVTVAGAVIAAAGLLLVLDVFSGASLSAVGVTWALLAMVGVAVYFVVSAQESELPPIVLAGGGLLVGALGLLLAAAVGAIDPEMSTETVRFAAGSVPWWLPILGLGGVAGALAYIPGIIASRMLGSRLASFVALFEVLFAIVFAWLLLDELPGPVQLAGGALILAGVVVVKLGERHFGTPVGTDVEPLPIGTPEAAGAG